MRNFRRLVLAVVIAGAAFLLPSSLGGGTGYVRSYGNSMEPMFHAGDLAVIRSTSSYKVGDIVAYRSPRLDRVVLHRIIDRDGDAFVFQGDNNNFIDPERLGNRHILGRLLVRLPRAGAALVWLTDPLHAAGVAVTASVLPAVLLSRRRRRRQTDRNPTRGRAMSRSTAIRLRSASPWLAAVGAALLLAGGVAFTRPTTQMVARPVAFTQRGSFTYSAPSSSPLYADGFSTGDPIFTRIADRVTVRFAHRVESKAATALSRTVAVDATLFGSSGWERTVQLVDRRALEASETDMAMTLDLSALRRLALDAQTITGTAPGELGIAVTPVVDINGTIAGQAVADRFEPTLAFTLDDVALRLVAPTDTAADGVRSQVKAGTVGAPTSRAQVLPLHLPGPDVTVADARTVGLAGGTVLLLLAFAVSIAGRPRGDDEPARIAVRYGRRLVHGTKHHHHGAMIELSTITDVMRLADHHDRLVVHQVLGARDIYLIDVDGTAYVYTVAPEDEVTRHNPLTSDAAPGCSLQPRWRAEEVAPRARATTA